MIRVEASGGLPLSKRRWVLVTDGDDGQNRSALAAVRALAAASYRPVVATASADSLAASSRDSFQAVRVPQVGETGFADAVYSELGARDYLCAFPASDAALLALDAPGLVFLDKGELARRAEAAGISVLPGRSFDSRHQLCAAGTELEYPVVVKPKVRGPHSDWSAVRVASRAELERKVPEHGSVLVQPWVDEPMRAIAGVVWGGRLVAAAQQRYLRTWPVDCGVASSALTIEISAEDEEPILRMLHGYEGVFQAQFVGEYLVDLNPRVYGSLPLAVAAGTNLVSIACDLAAGRTVAERRARAGIAYRWLEGDLRHLFSQLRSRSLSGRGLLAALRPRTPTAHSVTSFRDPQPFLRRLIFVLRKAFAG